MSSTEPAWFFPPLGGGEESGLNEPGIQSFKRVDSLARETVQNVLDHPDGSGAPRVAEFELIKLPAAEFPGIDGFSAAFNSCAEHVLAQLKGKKVGNEEEFFSRGKTLLSSSHIPVLRIGDRNTTGLVGDDLERDKAFFRLLRGQGFSTSEGKGGGTYGIGQRAPFAYSALRTVLYSTKVASGAQAFVAKAILSSHPDPAGQGALRQAKGWWCVQAPGSPEFWRALRDPARIPSRFRREAVGTDLYVVGFIHHSQWEQDVRHSVLKNFFAAIHEGDLVVRLMRDGQLLREMTKDTLEKDLSEAAEEARVAQKADDWRQGLLAAVYYLKALKTPVNGAPFEKEIAPLGKCRLYVFRDPADNQTPQTWAFMRSPRMVVGQSGSQLLDHYAAVFICDTEEGNQYLAKLEDLAHTRWHQDELRSATEAERKAATEVISAVRSFVRESLKSIAGAQHDKPLDVPLLAKYLPGELPEEDDSAWVEGADKPGARVSTEASLVKAKAEPDALRPKDDPARPPPRVREIRVVPTGGPGGEGPGKGKESGGRGGRAGRGTGDGGEGPGTGPENPVLHAAQVRFRSYLDGDAYVVVLHGLREATGALRLVAVGEGVDPLPVEIASATDEAGAPLAVQGSEIPGLSVGSGQTRRLRVRPRVAGPDVRMCLSMGE